MPRTPSKFGPAARRRFLDHLRETGHLGQSATAAGVSYKTVRLYDLRHTCCTLLLAAGVNVKVVAERLGHASAAMTLDVYGHVLPGMQEQATAALEREIFSG